MCCTESSAAAEKLAHAFPSHLSLSITSCIQCNEPWSRLIALHSLLRGRYAVAEVTYCFESRVKENRYDKSRRPYSRRRGVVMIVEGSGGLKVMMRAGVGEQKGERREKREKEGM